MSQQSSVFRQTNANAFKPSRIIPGQALRKMEAIQLVKKRAEETPLHLDSETEHEKDVPIPSCSSDGESIQKKRRKKKKQERKQFGSPEISRARVCCIVEISSESEDEFLSNAAESHGTDSTLHQTPLSSASAVSINCKFVSWSEMRQGGVLNLRHWRDDDNIILEFKSWSPKHQFNMFSQNEVWCSCP